MPQLTLLLPRGVDPLAALHLEDCSRLPAAPVGGWAPTQRLADMDLTPLTRPPPPSLDGPLWVAADRSAARDAAAQLPGFRMEGEGLYIATLEVLGGQGEVSEASMAYTSDLAFHRAAHSVEVGLSFL